MQSCLGNQTDDNSCKLTDLECICKISSSIEKNTYFKQSCLWLDCLNDLGRDGEFKLTSLPCVTR
jgi:hypothetical protein